MTDDKWEFTGRYVRECGDLGPDEVMTGHVYGMTGYAVPGGFVFRRVKAEEPVYRTPEELNDAVFEEFQAEGVPLNVDEHKALLLKHLRLYRPLAATRS